MAVRLGLRKHFSLDELQYAHAAWLVGQGEVPYRDFFEVHFPFVYQWLAPWAAAAGGAPATVAQALRWGMLPLAALAGAGAYRVGAAKGRAVGALTVAVLFSIPDFTAFATEIRPDSAAAAFLLAVLGLLAAGARPDEAGPGEARRGPDREEASGGASQRGTGAEETSGGANQGGAGADRASGGASQRGGGAEETSGGANQRGAGADRASGGADQRGAGAEETSGGANQRGAGADRASGGAEQRGAGADRAGGEANQRGGGAEEASGGVSQRGASGGASPSGAGSADSRSVARERGAGRAGVAGAGAEEPGAALTRTEPSAWSTGGSAGRCIAFGVGLALVACVWSSQKALFYAAPLFAALVLALLAPRLPSPFAVPRWSLAGVIAGVLAIATYLVATGSAEPLWRWCIRWAAEHQRGYPGFGFGSYFRPVLRAQAPVLILAVFGAAFSLLRRPSRWSNLDALLLLLLPFTFGSFALQRAPFPYSFVPFLGVAAIFAARGAGELLARVRALPMRVALCGGLAVWAVSQGVSLERRLQPTNAHQLATLRALDALTAPSDVVYDNSGGPIARPHAHFFFYTDAFIRSSRAEQLSVEIPQALLARECVAQLWDLRAPALPPAVRAFLEENYQPWDGDLRLWGRRYEASGPSLQTRFYAVKAGQYFANVGDGSLTVGGKRAGRAPFHLERGWHDLRYDGPPQGFDVLWLPRNGERWTPKRGAEPQFSRLF